MNIVSSSLDAAICLVLLLLAWRAMQAPRLFESVALFMMFGLLLALTWARLGSVDLALAEAAIGSGFTGALLFITCRELQREDVSATSRVDSAFADRIPSWLAFPVCLGVGLALGLVFMASMPAPGPVSDAVASSMDEHVLVHGVTAVLIDFRGYDTLCEMIVLLLAVVGLRTLMDSRALPDPHPPGPFDEPMVRTLLVVVGPLILATAVYLLLVGAWRPGGAFQAGTLLGALGILLRLSGRLIAHQEESLALRALPILGVAAFSVFAMTGLVWAEAPLAYPDRFAYGVMLALEFCLAASIAVTLVLLFGSARGLRRSPSS